MPVIAVANLKGGVGKSTLATTLAAGLSSKRTPVVLIDGDPPQNSSFYWAEVRDDPQVTAVKASKTAELERALATEAEWHIIDCAPRVALSSRLAMLSADLVLIPSAPTAPELWALDSLQTETADIADELPPMYLIWNRWQGWKREQGLAAEVADEYGMKSLKATLGNRVAYSQAFMLGKSAAELAHQEKATAEISALIKEVKQLCR